MIKYANIKGYKNLGEKPMFSHVYQFLEDKEIKPMGIIVHAYVVSPARVFKGYIFHKTQKYQNVDLTDEEKETINKFIGQAEQVDFLELVNGHEWLKVFADYTEQETDCKNKIKQGGLMSKDETGICNNL